MTEVHCAPPYVGSLLVALFAITLTGFIVVTSVLCVVKDHTIDTYNLIVRELNVFKTFSELKTTLARTDERLSRFDMERAHQSYPLIEAKCA